MPQRPPSRVLNARRVQMLGDGLDTHWPRRCRCLPRLGGRSAVTVSAWKGSISRVFLMRWHRAARRQRCGSRSAATRRSKSPGRAFSFMARRVCFAFSLGLVFVEQRHDLADHVAHGIVAELLGDRDQPDAVLGKPADIELKLELVAEEAAEAVHHDHVEHRRFCRGGVDHALELRPPVVGGGCAGFDIVSDNLQPCEVQYPLLWRRWSGIERSLSACGWWRPASKGRHEWRGHSGSSKAKLSGGSRTTHRTGRRTRLRTLRSRPR